MGGSKIPRAGIMAQLKKWVTFQYHSKQLGFPQKAFVRDFAVVAGVVTLLLMKERLFSSLFLLLLFIHRTGTNTGSRSGSPTEPSRLTNRLVRCGVW